MTTRLNLVELSNILVEAGYPDLFNYSLDRDIIDLDTKIGSVCDLEADNIVYFDVIEFELDEDGYLCNTLEIIVECDLDTIVNINN